ncbi:hypothetical protein TIFTF001_003886 [Ficus carica]|uniref:Uncharacterized protein n=1 Tax=Ficus carica TaxID=3494 RepID=A0AA88CWV0_FICCA|nr:hypothetical protein TIFTF001_003886 [Ficus carica]
MLSLVVTSNSCCRGYVVSEGCIYIVFHPVTRRRLVLGMELVKLLLGRDSQDTHIRENTSDYSVHVWDCSLMVVIVPARTKSIERTFSKLVAEGGITASATMTGSAIHAAI